MAKRQARCEKLLGGSGLRGRGRRATPVATTGIRKELRKVSPQVGEINDHALQNGILSLEDLSRRGR
jgi:hypothetical protein